MTEILDRLKIVEERASEKWAKIASSMDKLIEEAGNNDAAVAAIGEEVAPRVPLALVFRDVRSAIQDWYSTKQESLHILYQEILFGMERSREENDGFIESWQQLERTMQLLLNWVESKRNTGERENTASSDRDRDLGQLWEIVANILQSAAIYSKQQGN